MVCRTPTVLYDNHVEGNPHVTYVGVDNMEGMEQAVEHLRQLGHRKIGYLSGGLNAYVYRKRYQAFFKTLQKNDLPDDPEQMGNAYHVKECLEENMPRLLAMGCTAIVCCHDLMASAAVEYCNTHGLRIPEDVSIMGYDDSSLCLTTTPPLTSVRQNRTELGKSAFYALNSQINQVRLSVLLLHTELIVRDSCGPAPRK